MAAGPVGTSWATNSWSSTSWLAGVWAGVLDGLLSAIHINDRMLTYLRALYGSEAALTPLILRYLADQSDMGYTARFKQLIQVATDATTE